MRIESKSAIKFARSYGEDLKINLQFLKSLQLPAISHQLSAIGPAKLIADS